jgi:hypothetical protein
MGFFHSEQPRRLPGQAGKCEAHYDDPNEVWFRKLKRALGKMPPKPTKRPRKADRKVTAAFATIQAAKRIRNKLQALNMERQGWDQLMKRISELPDPDAKEAT